MRRTWTVSRTAFLAFALCLGAGCTKAPPTKRKVAEGETADAKADGGTNPKDKKQNDKDEPPLGPIPDGPVAKVGDVEITGETFNAIYDLKLQKYKDRKRKIPRSADRRYRRSITERLIYQELLRQEAAKLGVDYDEEKLAERQAMILEYQAHVRLQGEEPKDEGGPLGSLHRMLTGMSANFGSEEDTALKAIDDGEAFLVQACETELEKDDVDGIGRGLLKQALSSAKSGEAYADETV